VTTVAEFTTYLDDFARGAYPQKLIAEVTNAGTPLDLAENTAVAAAYARRVYRKCGTEAGGEFLDLVIAANRAAYARLNPDPVTELVNRYRQRHP
jgi:hypothetical protein